MTLPAVLVADPPWFFSDRLPGATRGAARQYPCMSVTDLMRFPLPTLAPDALLCLWRVAAMQQEALDVVRAWGFKVKSELVWEKLTKNEKPWFGMGRIVRASHEVCLIATRGKFKPAERSVRSRFAARVGRHSEKPAEFYRVVERLSPGPYIELFARQHRPGWTCLGNELQPLEVVA